ncbi:hypothetical protein NDU88_008703 [Pleurodeles waltl]|uniref:Uncharacterized protein n=1 Tax=Pleurodeles waltl TaxID=8319 RepID=A0AAV7PQK4_PLEWA|nr:hypothetical protein NDU88_008703 [Pleurodeles waltl]
MGSHEICYEDSVLGVDLWDMQATSAGAATGEECLVLLQGQDMSSPESRRPLQCVPDRYDMEKRGHFGD